MLVKDNEIVWEFEFANRFTGEHHLALLGWEIKHLWDKDEETADKDKLLKVSLIGNPAFECDCEETFSSRELCPHVCLAIEYLSSHLSRAGTDEALTWIQNSVHSPMNIGDDLIAELEQKAEQSAIADEKGGKHRLQWRIEETSSGVPRIHCYVRKCNARGHWTAGRRIKEIIQDCPSDALEHPIDRMMALFVDNQSEYRSYSSTRDLEVLLGLEILKDCPDVVWEDDPNQPAKVVEGRLGIELIDAGDGVFTSEVRLDGEPFQPTRFIKLGKSMFMSAVCDRKKGIIKFFKLSDQHFRMIGSLINAKSRGGAFRPEAAEKLSRLVSSPDPKKSLPIKLPESLVGPDTPLDPDVELQLLPIEPKGIEARIRVRSAALDELPVPGIGPDRIPVSTPAGNFQLVRNLPDEASAADRIADLLQMGELEFDGPYTWRSESIEAALKLVQRVRDLGEEAPVVTWPKSEPLRMIGEITPQSLKVRLTSDKDWFGIEGELRVEGLHLPLAELMAALRNGSRYVQLSGNQFAVISDALRSRLSVIDDVCSVDATKMRMSRAAAPIVEEMLGDDIAAEMDHRWQDALTRLSDLASVPTEAPTSLNAELRDYQVAGYQWLSKLSRWGLGGVLADDMGLGKTVQTLGVLLDRAEMGPTLVVAPTSVGINWARETARFAPSLKPHLYREHERDALIQSAGPGDLIIMSYQLLQRDIDRIAARQWSTLVLDEAQYIKNFQTKTNQAVRRLESDWCIALSGTPLENHLGELWSLMRVVCPGLLGSWERFRRRFGEPIERNKDKDRLQALGHVVRPFILRRTKQEVLKELPDRTEIVLNAVLSEGERKRYDAARLAALSDLTSKGNQENEQQKRIRVLSWLTRLRQLACHPRLVDDRWTKSSAKLDLFMEVVKELKSGDHRALVFSQFVQHLTIVREALDEAGISYQYLDGSTPTAKRQEAVDAFQNGEGDLFLISLKAGGTGLNLTAADYVMHLDPWWNPAVEDQATDRAHRIGQTRAVTVYRLVAENTIEEQILSLHEDKRALIAGVLNGADRAAKMSTTELVDLIRDSQIAESL
ncbi:MAG: DEAD/DEAH box helicase [Pirellulales bacterium]